MARLLDNPLRVMKVLIIDDERAIRNSLGEILTDEGYEVDTAEDGASGLQQVEKEKYDVIFNDAFSGKTPVKKLATLEAVMAYRDHLNEGGIYMANVIGRVFGEGSEFVKSAVATVSRVFRHVHVLYTNPFEKDGMNRDNYMIMATDREILPNDRMHYHISRFDRVLTDEGV